MLRRVNEPEELTDAQVEELHAALKALQTELGLLLEDSQEGSKPVDLETPIGRLSRMDAMQQQSMAKANRAASKQRLQLVRVALTAVEAETFGYCRKCEEPIGYRRLKAKPESAFCLACQGAIEKRHSGR